MRRDRTGDVVDDEAPAVHVCDQGWVGETDSGARVPCLVCRPHLVRSGGGFVVRQHQAVLSERQFQQQVVDYARMRGWRHFHAYNSQRSAPGWPDLALVRRGRFVVAELKTERGRVNRDQERWLNDLRACPGVETHLWRPSDWPLIQRVLT